MNIFQQSVESYRDRINKSDPVLEIILRHLGGLTSHTYSTIRGRLTIQFNGLQATKLLISVFEEVKRSERSMHESKRTWYEKDWKESIEITIKNPHPDAVDFNNVYSRTIEIRLTKGEPSSSLINFIESVPDGNTLDLLNDMIKQNIDKILTRHDIKFLKDA
jgi:hypothetical protein